MVSANERRCYCVMPSLIGWAHTQNNACKQYISLNENNKNNKTLNWLWIGFSLQQHHMSFISNHMQLKCLVQTNCQRKHQCSTLLAFFFFFFFLGGGGGGSLVDSPYKEPVHDDVMTLKCFPHNWPFVRETASDQWFSSHWSSDIGFDVFFDVSLNKLLNKQPSCW